MKPFAVVLYPISLLFEIPRSDTKTKCQLIKNALNQLLVKFSNNTFYSLKAQKQSTLRLTLENF